MTTPGEQPPEYPQQPGQVPPPAPWATPGPAWPPPPAVPPGGQPGYPPPPPPPPPPGTPPSGFPTQAYPPPPPGYPAPTSGMPGYPVPTSGTPGYPAPTSGYPGPTSGYPNYPPQYPYPGAPQPGGGGNRGVLIAVLIGLIVLVLIGGGTAAVLLWPKGDSKASPGPTGTPSATAGPTETTTQPQTGGDFQIVEKLCDTIDLSALKEILPKFVRPEQGVTQSGRAQKMFCRITMEGGSLVGLMQLNAEVYPEGAQDTYEGLKSVETNKTTAYPNVGTDAYSYVDDTLGPHIVTYQGSMYITIGWAAFDDNAKYPTDMIDRLAKVARSVLDKLRK